MDSPPNKHSIFLSRRHLTIIFSLKLYRKAKEHGRGKGRKQYSSYATSIILTFRLGRKNEPKQKNTCGLLIHFKDSSINSNKNSEYAMNINYMPGALLNILIYSLIKLHKVPLSNYLKDEEIETQIKKIMKDNLPIWWQK